MSSEKKNSNKAPSDLSSDAPLADGDKGNGGLEKDKTVQTEIDEVILVSNIIVQRYEGERRGKLFHGQGVAFFYSGNVYKGTFVEGIMHGYGEHTWVDGLKYEGNFELNVPMGHGTYTWPDGSSYEGEVHNGVRHGTGTYKCGRSSTVYKGQWDQGKRHGKGTIYYNKELTSWYKGDWQNNHREGWGERQYVMFPTIAVFIANKRYPSGNIYEGQWKNNIRHGQGKMRWVQLGQQYTGQWINGIQHGHGTHTWFLRRIPGSQYPLRNEYKGEFVEGLRHGQGIFFYSSGAVYSGGWKQNKKHGQGKFIFKNGRIFEGEFIEDRMAEFPEFSIDGTKTPDLSGIRTHTPDPDEGSFTTTIKKSGGNASLLGSDLSLSIQTLLNQIPEPQREQERRQVECVIMRHISLLRGLYGLYSGLGHERSPDNTFLLTRLQFWRFLKDCGVDQHGITLAQMDRYIADHKIFDVALYQYDDFSPEDVHSPFTTFLLRQCLSCIVIAAYHVYHNEVVSSSNVLAECLSKLMKQNIIPSAKNIKGPVFCHPHRAVIGMQYIEKCWEIYQAFAKANLAAPSGQSLTARQFIWMLNDFGLFDSNLSIAKVLEFLSLGDSTHCSLDLEITFLEFFETLVSCAVQENRTDKHSQNEQEDQDKTSRALSIEEIKGSSINSPMESTQMFRTEETTQSSQSEEFEQDAIEAGGKLEPAEGEGEGEGETEGEPEDWTQRIHKFFTQIFFPAYEHTILPKQ